MDVKDLQDLPGYRELIPFGLPRFQFTARMVPEGTLWLAFSAVNDSTYALVFADRLLAHLARCGVDLRPLVVQTDHGSEFGGNWNRRHGLPPFTKLVEQKYGCRQHRFNPPHRSTYNSDVEAVHGIMEREFYELERFRGSVSAFLGQAYSYQLYFNLLRRNSAKAGRTPEQLRQARAPTVRPEVSLLPPVMLSSLHAQDLPLPRQVLVGQDVPGYVRAPVVLVRRRTAVVAKQRSAKYIDRDVACGIDPRSAVCRRRHCPPGALLGAAFVSDARGPPQARSSRSLRPRRAPRRN
jgi:hypothetical protein